MRDVTSGHHPTDRYSRSAAKTTNYTRLVLNFEDAAHIGQGDVELVASVAIARVELLEQRLALYVDERRAASELRPRSGQVENVVPLRKQGAPTPCPRLGA